MLRRTTLAASLAGAAGALVLLAGPAFATVYVAEDFETTPTTLTPYGVASIDCTTANTLRCSLKVPASTGTTYSGAALTGTFPMIGQPVASFAFKADSATGDTDANFTLSFNTGMVRMHVTEGVGSNNGVSLYSATNRVNFTSWPTAGVWYTFTISIDPVAHTATGTLVGGGSATVSIPSGATAITGIDASGINWNWGSDVHFDTITLTT
jgi:hypothetical protein